MTGKISANLKKIAAGLCAFLITAGTVPVQPLNNVFGTAISANAEDYYILSSGINDGVILKSGDTVDIAMQDIVFDTDTSVDTQNNGLYVTNYTNGASISEIASLNVTDNGDILATGDQGNILKFIKASGKVFTIKLGTDNKWHLAQDYVYTYTKESNGIADGIMLKPGDIVKIEEDPIVFDNAVVMDTYSNGQPSRTYAGDKLFSALTLSVKDDGTAEAYWFHNPDYATATLSPDEGNKFMLSYGSDNMWHLRQTSEYTYTKDSEGVTDGVMLDENESILIDGADLVFTDYTSRWFFNSKDQELVNFLTSESEWEYTTISLFRDAGGTFRVDGITNAKDGTARLVPRDYRTFKFSYTAGADENDPGTWTVSQVFDEGAAALEFEDLENEEDYVFAKERNFVAVGEETIVFSNVPVFTENTGVSVIESNNSEGYEYENKEYQYQYVISLKENAESGDGAVVVFKPVVDPTEALREEIEELKEENDKSEKAKAAAEAKAKELEKKAEEAQAALDAAKQAAEKASKEAAEKQAEAIAAKKAADAKTASIVGALLNALPAPEDITKDHIPAVAAARLVYDQLSDEQKAIVGEEALKKLTDAEAAVAALAGTDVDKPAGLKGDVNGNGKVDVTDISKAAAHVKSIKPLSEEELKRADVNGDNKVDVTDLSAIAAHVKSVKALK